MGLLSFLYEVTPRCNHQCGFCYNVWKGKHAYPMGELSLDEIKTLFDPVFEENPIDHFVIGGGDPLLREDLDDVVRYFKSKKVFVSLATNGTLLTQERLERLVDCGIDQIEMTLLSSDKDQHDAMCGHQGSFQKVCQAIVNARRLKRVVVIGFVATKENIHTIGKVSDLCFALDVNVLGFYRFVPTGKSQANPEKYLPTRAQINQAMATLDEKVGTYKQFLQIGIPIAPCELDQKPKNIKFVVCQGGLSKFTVDPLGNLRVCEQSPDIIGNLRERSFLSMLKDKQTKTFRRFQPESCSPCKEKRICRGGCRFLMV